MKKILLLAIVFCAATSLTEAQVRKLKAGPDQTILAGNLAHLKGKSIFVGVYAWSTNGTGTFSNANALITDYTPSAGDIQNGQVQLTLSNRNGRVSDSMNLYIRTCGTIDAGEDIVACGYQWGGELYLTATTTGYYESITWSSTGFGGFDETDPLNPVYFYDGSDVDYANIEIYATVKSELCGEYTDVVDVYFQAAPALQFPEPSVYQNGTDPVYANVYLYGYASSGTWSTTGSGTFDDPNSTSTAYYPSNEDAINGCVELIFVTNDPDGPCSSTSGSMTACFNPPCPEVNIGEDITVCGSSSGGLISLEAIVSGYAEGIYWETNGSGGFEDPNAFNATYYYDASDANNAVIEIYATISSYGCYNTDTLRIYLQAAPSLEFPEPSVFQNGSDPVYANVYLYGYASSGTWTSTGSGTFSDPGSTYTAYYPSPEDAINGCVELIFTTNDPDGPCGSTSGSMSACFNYIPPCPEVSIGEDLTICGYSSGAISFQAEVSGTIDEITWGTSGVGGFDDPNAFSTTYFYDQSDVDNAQTQISATVSNPGCSATATITVYLQAAPDLVFPEPSVYGCTNEPVYANVYLYGYASSGTWTTTGSGIFSDANATYSAYCPSAQDGENGCVDLIFTSNDPEGPCGSTSGSMTACFYDCSSNAHNLREQPIALFPNPSKDQLELKTNLNIDKSKTFITDITGNRVNFSWSGNVIIVSSLLAGEYNLHTFSEKGKHYVIHFIKQ